jgi:acyl carrier protein
MHLRVDAVNSDDDFFDVEGHSLLALAFIAEVESKFGVTNLVSSFANERTVASLAKAIESRALT